MNDIPKSLTFKKSQSPELCKTSNKESKLGYQSTKGSPTERILSKYYLSAGRQANNRSGERLKSGKILEKGLSSTANDTMENIF